MSLTVFPKQDLYNSFDKMLVITASFIYKKERHKLIRLTEKLTTNSVTNEINKSKNLYSQLLVQFNKLNKILYPANKKEYITKKSNKYKSIMNIKELFIELSKSYIIFNDKIIKYCHNNCYRDYMGRCKEYKKENIDLLNITEEVNKIITNKK